MKLKDNVSEWPNFFAQPEGQRETKLFLDIIIAQLQRIVSYTTVVFFGLQENEWQCLECRGPLERFQLVALHRGLHTLLQTPAFGNIEPAFVNDMFKRITSNQLDAVESEEITQGINIYAQSWLSVPLIFDGNKVGILSFTHAQPFHFTPRHAKLAVLVFNQVLQAQTRLGNRAQLLAVTQERQRMARELHDSVTQVFYGIELAANTAQTLLQRGETERTSQQLTTVLSLAEAGLIEMRALLFELRPESLQTEGLVRALFKQTEALRVRHELDVTLELGAEPDVPLEVKEALYRIAQESFQNIIKHARATKVKVVLLAETAIVKLKITDNGRGFDSQLNFPGHLGLVSMHERAALLGGEVKVESNSDGTSIEVCLPFLNSTRLKSIR